MTKSDLVSHSIIKFACQNLVIVGNRWAGKHFGHRIFDIFLPLCITPEEVRQKSFVACSSKLTLMKDLKLMECEPVMK